MITILGFNKIRIPVFCMMSLVAMTVVAGASAQSQGVASAVTTLHPVEMQLDSLVCRTRLIPVDGGKLTPNERDSVYGLVSAYYYDQFRHSQDPDAPYFIFLSKDAGLMMGIGGVVRMRGWYDWGGAIPANGFVPALIQIPGDPASPRKFGTTPAGTALFFSVIGENDKLGNYRLYVEANFNGYKSRDFKLKKAYAQVRDFTVGLASSTFSDPAAIAPTVDAQGATNKISPTNVLVRYMPTFGKFTFGVSAETPEASVGADGVNTRPTSSWLPDVAALVQYEWDKGQHVRLAGIVRTLGYRNLIEQRNVNKAGWGLQLSSVARLVSPVTTYLTFNCGAGYGSLCNDLIAVTNDLIADPEHTGELYAPFSLGYCVGVQYNFRPNLFSTVQFSQTRYMPSRDISSDNYKYGYCLTANIFWNPIERMQLGAEFDFGKRQNFSGEHRYARRVGALVQFSF